MIVCCGEALIDFLPRETRDGAFAYQPAIGGSIFNTAIALGRLGVETGFFGGLSSDFFGTMLRDGLRASHVDLRYAKVWDRPSTLAFVKLIDGHARYSFFDDNSATRMVTRKDLPKLDTSVTVLHCGSTSLIPDPGGAAIEALVKREAKRLVISLDPNIRPGLIKDRKAHLARLNRLIAMTDVLKMSDEDLEWMTGKRDFAAAAKKWLRAGAKVVLFTRGSEGVAAFTRRGRVDRPAVTAKVADTVGAGDTFTAGFLAALSKAGFLGKIEIETLSLADLDSALAFAARAAAVTVSRPGADPPWAHELS